MNANNLHLLKQRRFLPLFITMFLGSLNDNLFKNGLIILATFNTAYNSGNTSAIAAFAAGLFVLPFFLFSSAAGQIADKYEKSSIIRRLKYTELGIMLLAACGLYFQHLWFLLFVLFCMGAQSAFFGPIKYSILPDHLHKDELVAGNALVEAATFVSILLGTIIGGLVVMGTNGEPLLSAIVLCVAISGILASRFIPPAQPASPELHIQYNIISSTWHTLRYARENRSVFLCIIGISWFWFVGATFVSQFPPYVKDYVGGDEEVVTVFMTAFSIGVAIGALLCGRVLKGNISARTAPYAMVGVAACIGVVILLTPEIKEHSSLIGAAAFFSVPQHIALFIALMTMAACAGFVSVPLFAVMQARSLTSHRARVIAASNIMDALFMVAASLLAIVVLAMELGLHHLFGIIGVLCLPIALLLRSIDR